MWGDVGTCAAVDDASLEEQRAATTRRMAGRVSAGRVSVSGPEAFPGEVGGGDKDVEAAKQGEEKSTLLHSLRFAAALFVTKTRGGVDKRPPTPALRDRLYSALGAFSATAVVASLHARSLKDDHAPFLMCVEPFGRNTPGSRRALIYL